MTARDLPDSICVVLLTGLGDVVHGLPLVNAIRDASSKSRITWVVEPMPSGLLLNHPSVERVVVFRRKEGLSGVRQLSADLRNAGPFDLTLNLNVYFKSVWPTLLSRAPRRIGFDRARSFEGVWLTSNEHLPVRPRAHTADMFLEFASLLGIPVDMADWRLRLSDQEKSEQREFFARFEGRPVATIVPASASYKKDWLPDRWAKVADSLEAEFGFQVVLAGGPGKREQAIARQIVDESSAKIEWAMGDSVRRLTSIIAGSNLVLGPDTGPLHIARAMDVPVIGIFGHTNPWRVGPWRAFEDLWVDHYTDPAASPDPANRLPKWEVMPTIQSEEVLDRVRLAISKYGVMHKRGVG